MHAPPATLRPAANDNPSSTLRKLSITWSVSGDDYLDAFRSKKNGFYGGPGATPPLLKSGPATHHLNIEYLKSYLYII
jgi:hypothetical protein